MQGEVTLEEAIKFHGHLGPYLVLGLHAGGLALKKLGCKKYFGLRVRVSGATEKPKSCLIDGLQLSTGATFGKGNIQKLGSSLIKIEFIDAVKKKKLVLRFKKSLQDKLGNVLTHEDSESLARQLFKANPAKLFNLSPITYNL